MSQTDNPAAENTEPGRTNITGTELVTEHDRGSQDFNRRRGGGDQTDEQNQGEGQQQGQPQT